MWLTRLAICAVCADTMGSDGKGTSPLVTVTIGATATGSLSMCEWKVLCCLRRYAHGMCWMLVLYNYLTTCHTSAARRARPQSKLLALYCTYMTKKIRTVRNGNIFLVWQMFFFCDNCMANVRSNRVCEKVLRCHINFFFHATSVAVA